MDHIEDMESLSFIFRYSAIRIGIILIILVARASCIAKRQLPPRFLPTSRNVTVYRDGTATLRCVIEHLGPKTVVWRKVSEDFPLSVGNMMYAPNEEMSIRVKEFRRDKSSYDLIIKRAQPRHSGTYECQISAARVYTFHVNLHVKNVQATYDPVINLTGTEYVDKDQKINLTCNATGAERAPEDIDWFHDGHKIYTNAKAWRNRIAITKHIPEIPGRSLISSLIIERSTLNDTGSYVCRSSDLETTSIKIHVLNAAGKEVIKREHGAQEAQTIGPNTSSINKVSSFILVTLQILAMFSVK